jgi:hypothetical protein
MTDAQNEPQVVVNAYAYRVDLSNPDVYAPQKAPHGQLFYIVHPNAAVLNRKYLYAMKRDKQTQIVTPVLICSRDFAMAWDCLTLASAYCKFVRYVIGGSTDYYVVLEPGNRRTEKMKERRKMRL